MASTPIASASAYVPTQRVINNKTGSSQANGELDKNGFLKLLTAQLANQDPMASQDPYQSFQVISQMTVVEQLTNLALAMEAQGKRNELANATALIGRTVTYTGDEGEPVTGTVESVQVAGGRTTITVDGRSGIDPNSLKEVR
jgi:flagellar basal-body rod modification protein FlgD